MTPPFGYGPHSLWPESHAMPVPALAADPAASSGLALPGIAGEQDGADEPADLAQQPGAARRCGWRRGIVQERVPQPPGEQPIGEYLVADYHTRAGKVPVGRGPERLAGGGDELHLHAWTLREHRRLPAGVRRKAHEEHFGGSREFVEYSGDATVQHFLPAVPVRDERLYVEDDRLCCQGCEAGNQALLAELLVSSPHGIAQLTGVLAVAARFHPVTRSADPVERGSRSRHVGTVLFRGLECSSSWRHP